MASKRWSGLNTYTVHEGQNAALGQGGCALVTGTSAATAPTGKTIIAITFLENSVFHSTNGLISEDDKLWLNTQVNATDTMSAGTAPADNEMFPAGITIYGRWNELKLTSGKVMVYLG